MALQEEKVFVISGQKKANVPKGNQCIFGHESNDRAQQKPNPNAATPSGPSMTRGRSVSRKRSIKGKSNAGIILRQPCRYCLKGSCTRSLCEYWHPPECQFTKLNRDAKQVTSVCSRTSRLKNNRVRTPKEL